MKLNVTPEELTALLERVRDRVEPGDFKIVEGLVETARWLSETLDQKKISIARLRRMLFGEATEKTDTVLGQAPRARIREPRPEAPKGHGRNGASDYPGALRVPVAHQTLAPGACCPACKKGKVYRLPVPGKLLVVVGQPALAAKLYEPERLRCALCGEVFTARLPEGVPNRKYDESAGSMVALLKYGTGLPFYRIEGLQQALGVPLPASTAWEIVRDVAEEIAPAYEELVRQAAQGQILHNDDTTMTVLELEGTEEKPGRKGVFTSGIVAMKDDRRIAIFATGRNHAGENLGEILKKRAAELAPPIQMCDGLSRNLPENFKALLANCLAHGRRKFVELAASFPEQCRTVLEKLRDVYRNDAVAKRRGLDPDERLAFHQAESGPIVDDLKKYLEALLDEKRVEPNSGLGKAIAYMLKRWRPLTLFLREPGAPLDNNICERALKMAILHRKNALFYKTECGARVGDLFMSLIHTCRLAGVNPFEYLTALQKHARKMRADPAAWMPWNFTVALAALDST